MSTRAADPLYLSGDHLVSAQGAIWNLKIAILSVKEESDLMIVTKDGKIIRIEAGEIRQAGRSTQGVRLVRMEEGDRVAAASVIPEAEPDPDKNGADGQGDLPLQ